MEERVLFGFTVQTNWVIVPCVVAFALSIFVSNRISERLLSYLDREKIKRLSWWERFIAVRIPFDDYLVPEAARLLRYQKIASAVGIAVWILLVLFLVISKSPPGPGELRWGR